MEKHARDVLVLEVGRLTIVADYFVICHGTTSRQVKAITEAIQEALGRKGVFPSHTEGLGQALWVLLDYGDVVVHVFEEATRRYYDLERLWGDAPRMALEEAASRRVQQA